MQTTTCNPIDYLPCADPSNFIEAMHSRLSHNYQSGGNLKGFLTAHLLQLADVETVLCSLLDSFTLDSAQGEQLDIIGMLYGLPRTICGVFREDVPLACVPDDTYTLQDYTFADDAEYKLFIQALLYSQAFDGTLKQYERIVQHLFDGIDFDDPASVGDTRVLLHGGGIVSIGVNRDLTPKEQQLVELYKYVLPYYGAYNITVYAGTDYFRFDQTTSNTTGLCQPFARGY